MRRFIVMFNPSQTGLPRFYLIETDDTQIQKKLEVMSGRIQDFNVNDVTISSAIFTFEKDFEKFEVIDNNTMKLDGEYTFIKTGYRR